MIPSILLALTVIVVMIDVLVGIHRGFGFSVIRLLIWIAGSFICALFARSFTVWLLMKMAKAPDMTTFASDTFSGVLTDTTSAIGTHLTGTLVSFMVPVVFIGMFLASKLITWIVYCIVKQIIKKAAKKAEAHNAAVDAVKAIQSSEMPDAETLEQQPIAQPSFASDEHDSDFGTFGIYPKEEETGDDDDEEVTEIVAVETVDNAVTDGFGSIAEAVDEANENVEIGAETASGSDGFEVIAAASGDGFESLAKEQKTEKVKEVKPVKEKKLRKKHSLSMLLMKKSVLSSVLGGILGAIISLYACAIIFAPVSEMVKIFSEEKNGESMVNLTTTFASVDTDTLFENAFKKDSQPITGIVRDFEITSDISIRPEDFSEAIDEHEDTVIYYIYKYCGASGVASFIYNKLTPVNIKDIKLNTQGVTIYNFPDTLRSYLELLGPADDVVDYMCSGKGFSIELLDKLEVFSNTLLNEKGKGEILTSADKTAIVNSLIAKLKDKVDEAPEIINRDYIYEILSPCTDIDEAKDKLATVFDLMRRLIRAGMFD